MYYSSSIISLERDNFDQMPVMSCSVSAGVGAYNDDEREYVNPYDFLTDGKDGCILVKIDGDSMVDQIKHGSYVVVDPYCEPQNGEAVICRLNGRNTCKYFSRKKAGLYLISGNEKYPPLEVKATDELDIVGKVIMIITRPDLKK